MRPFVFRLARRHRLTGSVCNGPAGVAIEAQGRERQLDLFAQALQTQHPPLASFDRVTCEALAPVSDEHEFRINKSIGRGDAPSAAVTVDTAACRDCVAELLAPKDRRFRHGVINCTNCGPRYSIIHGVPYDRPNTTMARFRMCDACASEYADPANRRFHAQPIACHDCGPRLRLVTDAGDPLRVDPISEAARRLRQGGVLAIKGLGGFHLAVRADDARAVARLRRLKRRDAKPFALMCPTLAEASRHVRLSEHAVAIMRSPACPIVLAAREPDAPVADAVAPANHRLGVMLPYTPIHHLLLTQLPSTTLVMTSGNLSDEPLVIDNDDAVHRLGSLCDAILWHDRPIERCVDDSVFIDMGDAEPLPIRRARGYVPAELPLPRTSPTREADGLCVGGELKNTIAVVRDGGAILSQHLGDLTHPRAFAQFKKTIRDLCGLFGIEPRWIAHDLHPLYLSTSHAKKLAGALGVPLIGIQHHHAHAAAVMAEHNLTGPVLAVICDGVGYGNDGAIWGGELLLADLLDFATLARLRPLRLPGGDAAAKDTRRCALALLHQAFGDDFDKHPSVPGLIADHAERVTFTAMVRRNIQCAASSAAGRVFDGAASLLGLCDLNHFEAQAPLSLEYAASTSTDPPRTETLAHLRDGDPMRIDLGPLTRAIVAGRQRGEPVSELAALFHEQFGRAWVRAVEHFAQRTGIRSVVLSGGVFCNQTLTEMLMRELTCGGLRVYRHRRVPPNDGGLSLGQAAIAAARFAAGGGTNQAVRPASAGLAAVERPAAPMLKEMTPCV